MKEENKKVYEEITSEHGEKLNLKTLGLIVIALSVFLGIGYFLYQKRQSQTLLPQVPVQTQDQTGTFQENVKEIIVEGKEFSFSPPTINLTKGEKVRVTFKNVGGSSHNLVIDELGVATKIVPPGGVESIEFVADKSGIFTFYCSVGNHKELGMEGKLEIK